MVRSNMVGGRQTNLFLRSLGPQDAMMLTPRLSRVECCCGESLATSDTGGALVYFPETILVGLEMSAKDSAVALIGREGLVGWAGLLGSAPGGYRAHVLMGGGTSLVIPAERLRQACFASPTLTLSLLRFVQSFALQMSWSLLSARSECLRERVCGLLLMIHDRIEGDEIPATHRALAAHLGVRRASITDTLHILEAERAVRSERGRILIRDRSLVESFAGSSYGAMGSLGSGPIAMVPISGREQADLETPGNCRAINAPAGPSVGFA